MRAPRVLLRALLLVLACLVAVRAAGTERGTVWVQLVGVLPLLLTLAWPALLVGVLRRDRAVVLLSAGLALAQLLLVVPALRAQPLDPRAAAAPRLRVGVANLYVLNHDPEATGRALRALDLDVLVVPELDGHGLAGLRASGLLDDLPHQVVDGGGAYETVGLLSRLPLADVRLQRGGGRVLPRATVLVAGRPVRLLAAHTLPPVWVLEQPWRAVLADLADEVDEVDGPAVVLGDLNADRGQGAYRALLDDADLRDAAAERGHGLQGTWPAAAPLLHLDHVLVRDGRDSTGLQVLDERTVRLPGTDHRAVVADLAVVS